MSVIYLIARTYLAAIWILAGVGKLVENPEAPLLSRSKLAKGRSAVRLLSVAEVGIGLLLAVGLLSPALPLASAVLFACFGALHLFGRLRTNCGCFGALQRAGGLRWQQLIFWSGLSGWLAIRDERSLIVLVPGTLAGMLIVAGAGVVARRRQPRSQERLLPIAIGELPQSGRQLEVS